VGSKTKRFATGSQRINTLNKQVILHIARNEEAGGINDASKANIDKKTLTPLRQKPNKNRQKTSSWPLFT